MTAALLQSPLSLGLGLLTAGALIFVLFALPSFIFPPRADETPAPVLPPAPRAWAEPDFAPLLRARIESAWKPLDARLAALEDRPGAVPSAVELRGFYDGLDRINRGLADVRALADPLAAGARDKETLRRQVEELARRVKPLFEAAAAPGGAPERLSRRLAGWRKAWLERLEREGKILTSQRDELASRRKALEVRLRSDLAGLDPERGALSAGQQALAADRRKIEEGKAAAEAEKVRIDGELRGLDLRIHSLRTEITEIEERRSREAATSAEAARTERAKAREDQARWRESLKESMDAAAQARTRQEEELKALRENGVLETAALRKSLGQARDALEKERAVLAAAEAEFKEKSGREAGKGAARLQELRAQAGGLEKTRDLLAETLRRELEDHREEMASLRAWAAQRSAAMGALSAKAAGEAGAALEKVRAEKAALADALDGEKEGLRRDLSSLETGAAAERRIFEASLRRAEGEHRDRLAALAREEALLDKRLAKLASDTEDLKAQAERLRVKASARIFRRRGAHEKAYAEAVQGAEARSVEEQGRMARERMAIHTLEARLAARRRRLETLRARRRKAVTDLLDKARASLEAALETQRRTEGLVRERLDALKGRAASWESIKERWAAAPQWIEEGARSREAEIDMSSSAEMARLLASAENQGEAVRQAFVQNRETLERTAARLTENEGALEREETDFREILNVVESQSGRLERLKLFFQAVRLPSAAAQDQSKVA